MSPTISKGSPLCQLPRRFLSSGTVKEISTFNGRLHSGRAYDNMSLASSRWRETFTGLPKDLCSARLRTFYKGDARQACSSKVLALIIWLLKTLSAALLWCRQQVSIPYSTMSSSQKSSTQQASYRVRSIFGFKVRHFWTCIASMTAGSKLMSRSGSLRNWIRHRSLYNARRSWTLLSHSQCPGEQGCSQQIGIQLEPVCLPHRRLQVSHPMPRSRS